jgi:sugar phosphate isomerase/epimerase
LAYGPQLNQSGVQSMLIGNPMVYRQLPLEMAISKAAEAGYEALELWPPQIAECCTKELRCQLADLLRALGLLPLRLNCADRKYFQSLGSQADVQTALAGLRHDIDMAAELGMSQLLTWEGRRLATYGEKDVQGWVLDATVELLQSACRYGRERGINLTIEVHPFTLGIDLEWLISLYDRIDDPGFSVTYDCCHFAVGLPDGYVDAIGHLGSRIGHVHFSDSDLKSSEVHFAPGTGCLDLDGIVDALVNIKFSGSMMLDLWLYPLPDEGTRIGVPYVREVMKRLGFTS